MEQRQLVNKFEQIEIPGTKDYGKVLFKNIKNLQLDDDIEIVDFKRTKITPSGFMRLDEPVPYNAMVLTTKIQVPETDEEYSARIKQQEFSKKQTEEKEKLEYLRLKAIYEK